MNHQISAVLLLSVSGLVQCVFAAHNWTTFTSKQSRFRVQYPASWYALEQLNGLDVISFPPNERVHGVVLTSDGAELTVLKQPRNTDTLDQWIRADLLETRPEIQREVNSGKASAGCSKLIEVRWKWEGGPEQYFQETTYYCAAKTGLYRIRLTYWADNASGPELDAVALKVARSLRVW